MARSVTRLGREQAAALLVLVWQSETGRLPSRNLAELMLAQGWGLETARGESNIQHNYGNISGSYQGAFWRPPWFEVTDESSDQMKFLHSEMLANRAPRSFRAYPDHETGVRDYVSMLRRRFPSIVAAGESGNLQAFAEAVKSSGYCPDCAPSATVRTFGAFQDEFRRDGVFAHLADSPGGGGVGWVGPVALLVVGVAMAKRWL